MCMIERIRSLSSIGVEIDRIENLIATAKAEDCIWLYSSTKGMPAQITAKAHKDAFDSMIEILKSVKKELETDLRVELNLTAKEANCA